MATFREKELYCQQTFLSGGPYWHLFTSGKQTPIIFERIEDYAFAMNVVAQAALAFPTIKIVAFALMSNHLHILASGDEESIMMLFAFIRKRLARGLKKSGCGTLPDAFAASIKEVADLDALRNTIVYINRNGYVADPSHTPFSYPWGTAGYYFNRYRFNLWFRNLDTVARRSMFRGRVPAFLGDTPVEDGYVSPIAYCSVKFGMAMFRDAHHYFAMVSKNVEACASVAADIDDEEFLTDTELFTRISAMIKERYHQPALRDLAKAQKLDLARTLRYDFRSSNGQIRRILGLSQYEVDALFPLSAK